MDSPLPAETYVLPARGWQINQRHALIAGIVCWIGFAIMAALVSTGATLGFDDAGLRFFRAGGDLGLSGSAAWLEAVRDITALGGTVLRTLVSLAAIAALLFLRLRREAVLLAATILSGLLVETAIKMLVARPRPQIVPHLVDAGGMSFPSGHSFNSALGLIAVALAFATYSARRRVRWTIIGGAMILSALVASSRVVLGVHYPSDVIAGWLGGAGWAFLAAALFYRPAKAVADAAA
ncbi:MAG: phosphatase PAP2 family protein [Novosphingobium sp.]